MPTLTPPKRAATRYIIRSSVVLALVLAGIYWLLNTHGSIWLFMIPGLYWGWLRYRDAAIGADPERIVIRNRVLAKTTAIVRKNRAQDMTCSASLIQRYRDLANIVVSVASGDQGQSFQIKELESTVAFELLPWLSAGFQPGATALEEISEYKHLPDWSE